MQFFLQCVFSSVRVGGMGVNQNVRMMGAAPVAKPEMILAWAFHPYLTFTGEPPGTQPYDPV